MIDLLLGVYNYSIKPRLPDLQGHCVSSQEWKKDRTQMSTDSRGTRRGKGLFGCVLSQASQGLSQVTSSEPCHPPSPGQEEVSYGHPLDVLMEAESIIFPFVE